MDNVRSLLMKLGWNRGNTKEFLRSNKPHYLVKIPFHRRYPRGFAFWGGIISFLIFFSAPIYHGLFTTPEDVTPDQLLWREERIRGKTHVQVMREYSEKIIKEREEKKAKAALLEQIKHKV